MTARRLHRGGAARSLHPRTASCGSQSSSAPVMVVSWRVGRRWVGACGGQRPGWATIEKASGSDQGGPPSAMTNWARLPEAPPGSSPGAGVKVSAAAPRRVSMRAGTVDFSVTCSYRALRCPSSCTTRRGWSTTWTRSAGAAPGWWPPTSPATCGVSAGTTSGRTSSGYLRDPAGNFAEYASDLDVIVDDELPSPTTSPTCAILMSGSAGAGVVHRPSTTSGR